MNISALFKSTFVAAVLSAAAGSVNAYMLDDNYVGGDDHGRGDVIGYKSKFDVLGLDVSISGSYVTVDIATTFWDDIGVYSSLTSNGQGIGVGDLFLSSSWNPAGSASDGYLGDNSSTGTVWSYGVAVDNAYSSTGGDATFYALTAPTNADNALDSDMFMSGGIFRNGQEVAVSTQSDYVKKLSNEASWSVGNGVISFAFDATGTDLLDGELALHWAMLCGNDVIEGSVPVDVNEPATLGLLGLGLFGLAFLRRRV